MARIVTVPAEAVAVKSGELLVMAAARAVATDVVVEPEPTESGDDNISTLFTLSDVIVPLATAVFTRKVAVARAPTIAGVFDACMGVPM